MNKKLLKTLESLKREDFKELSQEFINMANAERVRRRRAMKKQAKN